MYVCVVVVAFFFLFSWGGLACKWEITTLMVIFDDRPSSTVVKKSFQSIYQDCISIYVKYHIQQNMP